MADLPFVVNANQRTYEFAGPFPAGTVVRLDWDGVTVDAPCRSFLYSMNGYGDDVEGLFFQIHHFGDAGPGTAQATLQAPRASVDGSFWTDSYCSTGTVHNLRFSSTFSGTSCQYGTELSPSGVANVFITAA